MYNDIALRGRIIVVEKETFEGTLSVRVGDIEAEWIESSKKRKRRSITCSVTLESGCTVPEPTGTNQIIFSSCLSSEVTSISPNEGNADTIITITGTGFGTDTGCVRVTIDGHPTIINSVLDTEIQTTVDPNDPPPLGAYHEVLVEMVVEGYAFIAVPSLESRVFLFRPSLSSVSPQVGSVAGGTVVTITGAGFDDDSEHDLLDLSVTISGTECQVTEYTLTEIICVTNSRTSAVTAQVTVNVKTIPADECPTPSDCQFEFSDANTPLISSVAPTEVDGVAPTNLVIQGSNFEHSTDPTTISVTIGGVTCSVTSSTDTSMSCTVTNLPVGSNTITILSANIGYSVPNNLVTVEGTANIQSINPTEGSTQGETLITITGNGFIDGDTVVTIDNIECVLESVSLSEVQCYSPPHDAGSFDLQVTSAGTQYPSVTYTYSAAATPTINNLTPTTGFVGTSIVITGTGFSDTTSDNQVTLGGVECTVTVAANTEITCTTGENVAGAHSLKVLVSGKGKAQGDYTFTYSLQAGGVTPAEGRL